MIADPPDLGGLDVGRPAVPARPRRDLRPKPQETVAWFVDVLGLETAREGQSVYLRGWAEWLHSSLIVTEGAAAGDRRTSPGAPMGPTIRRSSQRRSTSELAIGWVDASVGHGRRSATARRWAATCTRSSGRSSATRRRRRSRAGLPEPAAALLRAAAPPRATSTTSRSRTPDMHGDIALLQDARAAPHRRRSKPDAGLHRLQHDDLQRDPVDARPRARARLRRRTAASTTSRTASTSGSTSSARPRSSWRTDTPIEFGPGIHGIDEITYLYVREPGGFRIEINSGGWVNASRTGRRRVDARARAGRRSGRTCRCRTR